MSLIKPEVLIIGAAKSGTTSLAKYMDQHPEIVLAKGKEAHFFDDTCKFDNGVNYYHSVFFNKKNKNKIWVDATPAYMHRYKDVIPRIKKFYGNKTPKFIVLLRDPVDRSYSHYKHRVRNGKEKESFEKAIELEFQRLRYDSEQWCGYKLDSMYGLQLRQWMEAFGKDKFLILKQNELQEDTQKTLDSVMGFIGIKPFGFNVSMIHNSSSRPRFDFINNILNCPLPFKIPRSVRYGFIKEKGRFIRQWLRKINSVKECSGSRLSESFGNKFRKEFREDIEFLEVITGMRFDEWK